MPLLPPLSFLLPIDTGGGVVSWLLGVGGFAFSVWMAVDCWRRGREGFWIWLILFTGGFGALIYFFTQYWDGSRLEHGLWSRLMAGSRIREAKARAHHLDTAAAFEDLGDLNLGAGKWEAAEEAYREAMKRDASSLEAQAGRGYALLELEQYDEAWAALGTVYQKNPGLGEGLLIRQLARCQAARGNLVDARNLYEYFLRQHSYTEVQLEYAQVLQKAGESAAARKVLQELIDDAQHAPRFAQRRDRRWVREAKRLLKTV